MKKLAGIAFFIFLYVGQAFAQPTGQLQPGQLWGNPSGSQGLAIGTVIGALLDQELTCSAQGSVIYRGGSSWQCLGPGTTGLPLLSQGSAANLHYAQMPVSSLATGTQDTIIGYFGATTASALAINNCTGALIYSTSTHTFGCNTSAGSGTVTSISVTAGTGITQSGSPVSTSGSITVNVDKATAANLEAGTSNKVLTADIVYTPEVTVTFSTTPTFDMSTFINAVITMTGNISSTTFSNIKAGQAGTITFIQDATGSRTLPATFNTNFKFAVGVQPVLSTAANSIDVIFYTCRTTSFCFASLGKAFN